MPSSDPASLVNRLQGISGALGRKAPVRVASTGNVVLSGLQVIDGYQLAEGHRVLLKDQTTASENGIWNASSGNWTRSQDFNKRDDVANGTDVVTAYGSQAGRNYRLSFVEPMTFGATAITFTSIDAAALADGGVTTAKLADGSVTTPKIAAQAVTYDKLPDVAPSSFLGRLAGVAGSVGVLTIAQVKSLLGRWTNAELADMAPLTFKGNSSTDTTGAAQDMSVATVKTMLGRWTNAELADMPSQTIKGNNGGATGAPLNLTADQVGTLIETARGSLFATNNTATSYGTSSGYIKLANGFLICWGTYTGGDASVAFPVAFISAPFVVGSSSYAAQANESAHCCCSGISNTGFIIRPRFEASNGLVSANSGVPMNWIAIGK